MAALAMTEPTILESPTHGLDRLPVDVAASPLPPDLQPSRDLDLLTCSADDIVNHFAQSYRQIADATQHHAALLAQDPCDMGRARAIRALACAQRVLRMIQNSRIQLYRLAHPAERIPRSATRVHDPVLEEISQLGRQARELRRIGRVREQEEKANRRANRPRSQISRERTRVQRERTQARKAQSTGFSLQTLPPQNDFPPSAGTTNPPNKVRSTGFSLQTPLHPERSAPSAKTTWSSSNRQSSVGNRKSSIATHFLDLLEHPPSLTDPSIRKHLTDRSLLRNYITPPVASPFVQTLINQSAIRNPQSTIEHPQSAIAKPKPPISRAERRRRERRLRNGHPAPS